MRNWSKLVPISLFMICGCASIPAESHERLIAVAKENPIHCEQTNCQEKWAAAQVWIIKHTRMKMQTTSDTVVDTYDPCIGPFWGSGDYGFRIIKEPLGNGRFEIKMDKSYHCGLGGHADDPDFILDFNHYMSTGEDILASVK